MRINIPEHDTDYKTRAGPIWTDVWRIMNKRNPTEVSKFWKRYWLLSGKERDDIAGECINLALEALNESNK